MAGEGSVFRRTDGRWVATVSTGPRGNRRITTVYRHSRPEALDALAELRKNVGRLDRKSSVSAYLARWLRDADVRDTTRRGYQAVIDTHLDPAIGHLRLAALTPSDVRSMMAGLSGAPKTRRNVLIVLRRALREAVRAELVSRNVASPEYIDAPKVSAYVPDALTDAEVDRVLAALGGDPLEPYVVVALGTGLRQGEQLGLAWGDIDGDVIRVRWELARIDGAYRRVAPKTDRSRRDIPVAAPVRAALDRQRATLIAAGYTPISTGPVFPNSTGGEMSGAVLTHRWQRFLEGAGMASRPWKVLRATFGSRLHDAGVDDLTIADLMGHTRTYTTKRHYIARGAVDPKVAVGRVLGRTA